MFKRTINYIVSCVYAFTIVFMPTFTIARSGQEILAAQNNVAQTITGQQLSTKDTLPFLTKAHLVKKGETVAQLCRQYNISEAGFVRLNNGRFIISGGRHLKAGDSVILPRQPLSISMSHYLDGDTGIASPVASSMQSTADVLHNHAGASGLQNQALGMGANVVGSMVSQWLNQYGTVRLSLAASDKFSFKNSSFEMLLPLYDKGSILAFAQGALHYTDEREQTNLGLGVRYFASNYMVGSNAFLDYDLTHGHSRFGLGVEYWRDYLKLAANSYWRLSQWRDSGSLALYDARPANGWDVRAEAYLPSFPQLGAKLIFEKYYGSQVALLAKDKLQHNPYAVTVGLNYTPIPLLGFDLGYSRGKNHEHSTAFGAHLNYRFGVPLPEQLKPSNVDAMRRLQGGRYDLVDRNNNIVLDYRRRDNFKIEAPDHVDVHIIDEIDEAKSSLSSSVSDSQATALKPPYICPQGKAVCFQVSGHSSAGFKNQPAFAIAAAGYPAELKIAQVANSAEHDVLYDVTVPYPPSKPPLMSYNAIITGVDAAGVTVSKTVIINVISDKPSAKSTLTPAPNSIKADNKTESTITLIANYADGKPITTDISKDLTLIDTIDTPDHSSVPGDNADTKAHSPREFPFKLVDLNSGTYRAQFTTSVAGTHLLQVGYGKAKTPIEGLTTTVTGTVSVSNTKSTLDVIPNDPIGDASASGGTIFVTPKDDSGKVLKGRAIKLLVDGKPPTTGKYTLTPGSSSDVSEWKFMPVSVYEKKTIYTITATIDGQLLVDEKGKPKSVTITVIPEKPDSTSTLLANDKADLVTTIDTPVNIEFTAHIPELDASDDISNRLKLIDDQKPELSLPLIRSQASIYRAGPFFITNTAKHVFTVTYNGKAIDNVKATVTADTSKSPVSAAESKLSVAPASISDDGAAASTITVQLNDQYGNKLKDRAVELVFTTVDGKPADPANYKLTPKTTKATTTDAHGLYTAIFVAQKPVEKDTIYNVVAKSGAVQVVETKDITVKPIAVDNNATLTPRKATVAADGKTTQEVTLAIKDNKSDISTRLLLVDPDDGAGNAKKIHFLKGKTAGTYIAQFTTSVAGAHKLHVEYNGKEVKGDKVQATVTGDTSQSPVSADKSKLSVAPASISDDGVAAATIKVQLNDQYDNKLKDRKVELVFTTVDGKLADPASYKLTPKTATATTTDAQGLYTVTFIAQKPVEKDTVYNVVAKCGEVQVLEAKTITVTPIAVDNNATLTPPTATLAADGKTAQEMTLVIKNNLSDISARLKLVESDDSAKKLPFTLKGNTAGTYIAKFTTTKPGAHNLHVEYNGKAVKGEQATAVVTGDTSKNLPDKASTIVAKPKEIGDASTAGSVLTITLKDQFGNPLSGRKLVLLENSKQLENDKYTLAAIVDNKDGTYSTHFTPKLVTKTVEYKMSAQIGGVEVGKDKPAIITVIPEKPEHGSTLTAANLSFKPDGTTVDVLTLKVKDINGKPIVDDISGRLGLQDNGTIMPALKFTKGATPDLYTLNYTSTVAIEHILKVVYAGNIAVDTVNPNNEAFLSVKLNPPGDVDQDHSTVVVATSPMTDAHTAGSIITVTLKDKHDGSVDDAILKVTTVTLNITGGHEGTDYTISPVSPKGAGVYTATIVPKVHLKTNDKEEVYTITATATRHADGKGVLPSPVAITKPSSVNITKPHALTIYSAEPSAKSTIALSKSTSDDPDRNFETTVTFTALDAKGQAIKDDISKYLTIVAIDNYNKAAGAKSIGEVTAKHPEKGEYTFAFSTHTISEFALSAKYHLGTIDDEIKAEGENEFSTRIYFDARGTVLEFNDAKRLGGVNENTFTINGKKGGETIVLMLTLKDDKGKPVKNFPFNGYTTKFTVNNDPAKLEFKNIKDGIYSYDYKLPANAAPSNNYEFILKLFGGNPTLDKNFKITS